MLFGSNHSKWDINIVRKKKKKYVGLIASVDQKWNRTIIFKVYILFKVLGKYVLMLYAWVNKFEFAFKSCRKDDHVNVTVCQIDFLDFTFKNIKATCIWLYRWWKSIEFLQCCLICLKRSNRLTVIARQYLLMNMLYTR